MRGPAMTMVAGRVTLMRSGGLPNRVACHRRHPTRGPRQLRGEPGTSTPAAPERRWTDWAGVHGSHIQSMGRLLGRVLSGFAMAVCSRLSVGRRGSQGFRCPKCSIAAPHRPFTRSTALVQIRTAVVIRRLAVVERINVIMRPWRLARFLAWLPWVRQACRT
jgi:hypothetical protein